ncbi:MAG: hypothetical protein SFW36_18760 [Leptolyngbyaceae cyanobacterium bins.59]|nr:hypothetical protein [Leptolyngbyaceae cyanobacterium bins.59]
MIPRPRKGSSQKSGLPVPPTAAIQKMGSERKPSAIFYVSQRSSSKRKPGGWVSGVLSLGLLAGAGTLTIGGAWLGLQLIVKPETAIWLNQLLPAWTRIPIAGGEQFQTLLEIKESLLQTGLKSGEVMPLGTPPSKTQSSGQTSEFLLPVLNSQGQIVELRIYRPPTIAYAGPRSEPYFWLASQIPLAGPEESFVIAPLAELEPGLRAASRPLPLTTLTQEANSKLPPGIWLHLTGQWSRADKIVPYGLVIHYNPERMHFSVMAAWSSPAGKLPEWQEVTGRGFPELIIDQTIGLDPQFIVYQIQPRKFLLNPFQMEAISLNEPIGKGRAYRGSLILARSGLWSLAMEWFQSFQKEQRKKTGGISPDIQAQMDLVRLHATIAQSQATQTYASPSEQVLVNLLDGRWTRAVKVFQNTDEGREILDLLRSDTGRIGDRIETALRLYPTHTDLKAWGALLISAKQGRSAALKWVTQQRRTSPATVSYITTLLAQLDTFRDQQQPIADRSPRLLGQVTALPRLTPREWTKGNPQDPLNLEPGEMWYQIQVVRFYDGQRWQRSPFPQASRPSSSITPQIWKTLGLDQTATLQINAWDRTGQQETVTATVRAIQARNGSIQLLASGYELPGENALQRLPRPLALTPTALTWLAADSIALGDLNSQEPQVLKPILNRIWQELQRSGQITGGAVPATDTLLQADFLGNWIVQRLDLTGNDRPEVIVTIASEAIATLEAKNPKARKLDGLRTLIFSDSGSLIYSELGSEAGQFLVGPASLEGGEKPVLVMDSLQGYRLNQWSGKGKFEPD